MKVGIVIPAYNASRFIRETLESVKNQSYLSWLCVVVNDGSTDDTLDIVQHFIRCDPRFILLSQANAGVAASRNYGIAAIKSEVELITCADADDVYLPHALTTLVAKLTLYPDSIAVHAIAEFIDTQGDLMLPGVFATMGRSRITGESGTISTVPLHHPSTFANVVTASTMFPPGLLLMRRQIVDQVGEYDHTVTPADDWDYFIRLCRFGAVAFVNEVLVHYRRHTKNQGASSGVPEMCRRVFHKAFFSPENTPEQCRTIASCWRAKQQELIEIRWKECLHFLSSLKLHKALLCGLRIPIIWYRKFRGYPTLGWI